MSVSVASTAKKTKPRKCQKLQVLKQSLQASQSIKMPKSSLEATVVTSWSLQPISPIITAVQECVLI